MCLSTVWSREKRIEWLKTQPDEITAYKFVKVERKSIKRWEDGEEKIVPPFQNLGHNVFFEKENRIKKTTDVSKTEYAVSPEGETTYVAYFHLFLEKKSTERWRKASFKGLTLECKIPKKFITDIGDEYGDIVIITRGFDFVEGDEYFEK